MNLAEFKSHLDFICSHNNSLEDIDVLITLSATSIGARASSEVRDIHLGFDWEYNQLRIEPKENLVLQGSAYHDIIPPSEYELYGNKIYWCTQCRNNVNKADTYCRHCGQRIG